jgi:hypothetical protein
MYEPHWLAWAVADEAFDDVTVEVEARLASGPAEGHFGVVCRYADEGNFYYFAISPDGYYGVFRRIDGGELEPLTGGGIGMLPSSAIEVKGPVNTITAICREDELSLYVNGEWVDTVSDDALRRGDVGLGAGSGPSGGNCVRFDDFSVSRP